MLKPKYLSVIWFHIPCIRSSGKGELKQTSK